MKALAFVRTTCAALGHGPQIRGRSHVEKGPGRDSADLTPSAPGGGGSAMHLPD